MRVRDGIRYMMVALVAGGVGAVFGILMAPASGRETRRMMARRMKEAKEDVLDRGHRVVEQVAGKVEEELRDIRRRIA